MNVSYLIIDAELKGLLERFAKYHHEGSKEVLKLVLKMYLKLLDKSKRKGNDPLLIFKNLVERTVSGKLYETTRDKIDHLDILLEAEQEKMDGFEKTQLFKEIGEIKTLIRLRTVSSAKPLLHEFKAAGYPSVSERQLKGFTPQDAAKLLEVENDTGPKKRKSYRELRKKKPPKKIEF